MAQRKHVFIACSSLSTMSFNQILYNEHRTLLLGNISLSYVFTSLEYRFTNMFCIEGFR